MIPAPAVPGKNTRNAVGENRGTVLLFPSLCYGETKCIEQQRKILIHLEDSADKGMWYRLTAIACSQDTELIVPRQCRRNHADDIIIIFRMC